nr:unnamed protein product [Digitaria exilis]
MRQLDPGAPPLGGGGRRRRSPANLAWGRSSHRGPRNTTTVSTGHDLAADDVRRPGVEDDGVAGFSAGAGYLYAVPCPHRGRGKGRTQTRGRFENV